MAAPAGGFASPRGTAFDLGVQVWREQSPRANVTLEVSARITVREDGARTGNAAGARHGDLAVAVAVDLDADRDAAAREALAETLGALPPGCAYALIGADGRTVYPFDGGWATASAASLRDAGFTTGTRQVYVDRKAWGPGTGGAGVAGLLAAARAQFDRGGDRVPPVRHLLLVTDGSGGLGHGPVPGPAGGAGRGGQGAGLAAVDAELDRCAGRFTCDVLALDGPWEPAALLAVAERLHGRATPVADRFAAAAEEAVAARHGSAPELPLEIVLRHGVRLVGLEETSPGSHPLPAREVQGRPGVLRTQALPWRPGTSTYRLKLGLDATGDPLATDLQLAALSVGDSHAPVVVRWETRPRPRPTPPRARPHGGLGAREPEDASATPAEGGLAYGAEENTVVVAGAVELMRKELKRGKIALHDRRHEEAERRLGAAAQLAHQLGVEWALEEVGRVAEVVDARLGVVRVHEAVDREELKRSILHREGGTSTAPEAMAVEPTAFITFDCHRCGRTAGATAQYCIVCGTALTGARR
ncbi:hypothetical protein ACIP93_26110 [Streptomyces sp. NPDC088745]|uniref:hypothetical protein n=1 Tax=Streptomyces sp. NPDC088745 TaxID=3365884 RepID=UPI00381661DE